MDNWQMIGGTVVALGAILGVVKAFDSMGDKYKNLLSALEGKLENDRKATEENTKQLILLNSNFEHMRERDKERDELTKKSIDRLDSLSQRVDKHDYDIKRLNDTVFVKDRV